VNENSGNEVNTSEAVLTAMLLRFIATKTTLHKMNIYTTSKEGSRISIGKMNQPILVKKGSFKIA